MNSIIFRRTVPELGELLERSRVLYSNMGGTFNEQKKLWKWPHGARITLSGMEYEKDRFKHQGAQYSSIHFDESTHFSEKMVAYLWTRCRSVDPHLMVRQRLYTNPGGPGHDFHKQMFLRGVCPHCDPKNGPETAKLYHNVRWPGSNRPVGASVAFIPARLSDHQFFGEGNAEYIARLYGQEASIADALLAGCWNAFEGQYFNKWDRELHTCLRAEVEEQPWWPYWTGTDYGFGGSWAVGYLLTKSPEGIYYVLEELAESKMEATDYAKKQVEEWILNESRVRRDRDIWPWYLGPDSWNQRGDGHTLAGQMNKQLAEYDYFYSKASNDREGGAMLLYTLLSKNRIKICRDTCPMVCEAIPSRLHDPDHPKKVLKPDSPDKLDDAFDGVRYGLYSIEQQAEIPRAMQIAARIKAKNENMDALNQFVMRTKLEAEFNEKEAKPLAQGGTSARKTIPKKARRQNGLI